MGLCGGDQMLGRSIADPDGIEGPSREVPGLGLLDIDTVLGGSKRLAPVTGVVTTSGARFVGYEMHIGRSVGPATCRPLIRFDDGRSDGAMSLDGQVRGTYVHGLFSSDECRGAWLTALGAVPGTQSHEATVEAALDALAEHIEAHVDVERLLSLAR